MIQFDHDTGRAAQALPTTKLRLNGFRSTYDRVKIGATTRPRTPWELGHSPGGWDKMVVVYASPFAGSAGSVKRTLITHARGARVKRHPHGAPSAPRTSTHPRDAGRAGIDKLLVGIS